MVAALILLLVGFTQMTTIKKVYYQLFGTAAEKMLANSDQLTQSVEDQGLRLRALSTFKDEHTTYFLSELTDLTENRLSEDMEISQWSMNGGGNTRVIGYDEQTKTSTLLTSAVDGSNSEKSEPGFILNSFLSNNQLQNEIISVDWLNELNHSAQWIDLSKQSAKSGGFNEKIAEKYTIVWEDFTNRALQPMQKNVLLSKEQAVELSNIAYKDDFLHLQIKTPNTKQRRFTWLSLVNRKTGETKESMLSFQVDEGTHSDVTGRSDYEEFVYDIPQEEIGNYQLKIESSTYEVSQDGTWAIKLKVTQELPTITFENQKVLLEKQKVELTDIKFSALSLSFILNATNLSRETIDFDVEIEMNDGQIVDYSKDFSSNFSSDEEQQEIKLNGNYIDLSKVKTIKINGVELQKI